jgi:hypothetical protein
MANIDTEDASVICGRASSRCEMQSHLQDDESHRPHLAVNEGSMGLGDFAVYTELAADLAARVAFNEEIQHFTLSHGDAIQADRDPLQILADRRESQRKQFEQAVGRITKPRIHASRSFRYHGFAVRAMKRTSEMRASE